MKEKMQGVDYTIITVPDRVACQCPYCEWEQEIDFETFVELHGDEADAWFGNSGTKIECEYCGKEFELLDSILD